MKLIPLSKRVYVLEGNIDPEVRENAGFVVADNGVVVIDTTRAVAEALWGYRQIRTVTDKSVKYVINTHGHLDHVFGNQVFDAPIIAQRNDAEEMRAKLTSDWNAEGLRSIINAWARPEEMEGTRIVVPQILFSDALTLDMGNVTIEVIRVGGHTPGCSIVYVPEEQTVFLADLLCVERYPVLKLGESYCNVDEWLAALEYVKKLKVKAVVPGHGPVGTMQQVVRMQDYLLELRQRIPALAAKGLTKEQIMADPGFMKFAERTYSRLHGANIGYAYDMLISGVK